MIQTTDEEIHEDNVTTVEERIVDRFKDKPFSTKKEVVEELNVGQDKLEAALKREFGTHSIREVRRSVIRDSIEAGVNPYALDSRLDASRDTVKKYVKEIVGEIGMGSSMEEAVEEYQEGMRRSELKNGVGSSDGESEDAGTTQDVEDAVRIVGALYAQEECEVAVRFLEGWKGE